MEDEYPNAATLAEKHETSEKTIREDIKWMRDGCEYPIAYDESRKGFYYTRKDVLFFALALSENEVNAICLSQNMGDMFRGTPFAATFRAASKKLIDDLQRRTVFDLRKITECVSVAMPPPEVASTGDTFRLVFNSILANKELRCTYKVPGKSTERTFEPSHLHKNGGIWYLFNYDLNAEGKRTFRLHRMHDVERTGNDFTPRDLDWREELQHSLGIYGGKFPLTIRVRFFDFAADYVSAIQWHESARFEHQDDGTMILTMQLANNFELERWCLQWGGNFEILEPRPLRLAVYKSGLKMTERNKCEELEGAGAAGG